MFVATALLYPCLLAVLCLGAGLLVRRASGGWLPAPLLLVAGAAALIGASQLVTDVPVLAPATPYAVAALACAGLAWGWADARALAARAVHGGGRLAVGASVLAYALALAPVLAAGRPTFSSFMALSDSAVHLIGADYLIHHGQSYAHLDLHNSYGQFIKDYYGTSYPSGADTLFGASALLVRLPLIWAFQPFNAFMLALAVGPAWMLARALGLRGGWAAAAVLSATVPALVYAYVLLASVKEISSLPMILALGALTLEHRRWLGAGAARALPFGLVAAAGVSALGLAFCAWALTAVLVLAVVAAGAVRGGGRRGGALLASTGVGALTALIAAWPTWSDVRGSLEVARNIATTSNPGNLHAPLRAVQVLGVWLHGSYKLAPTGTALTLTHALMAATIVCAVLGAAWLARTRSLALAGWVAMMLLAWIVVSHAVTTWADAKTLVLTSSVVVLLAWGGVGALARARAGRWLAAPMAAALLVGVLVSDALQYHSSNLAPTARYDELASIGTRFADQGPTLFTDFDEYSMYELRQLDVGGPDFVYPPPAAASAAGGYGYPVDLDRLAPSAFAGYPLIVTRRDPAASRPPASYALAWQGSYYQVWRRLPDARVALAHVALSGSTAAQCAAIGRLARSSPAGATLVVADAPQLVRVALASASRPRAWGRERQGFVMSTAGTLTASFSAPRAGRWYVWLLGQFMPSVTLSLDGRAVRTVSGQLSGNSLVAGAVPPVAVSLAAGPHKLALTRGGFSLAPGAGGSAVLDDVYLTPAAAPAAGVLRGAAPARWRRLCGRRYQWAELLPAPARGV